MDASSSSFDAAVTTVEAAVGSSAVTVRDSGGSWKRRKKHDDKIIFLYNSNIKLNTFKINPVNFIYINFIQ